MTPFGGYGESRDHIYWEIRAIYHNKSAAIVTAATLVTGELQVPFLPFLGHQPTNSLTHPTTLQQLQHTPENSEVYDLWSDCRGDSAFGIGCLAIT
jgi:hypothetical protein